MLWNLFNIRSLYKLDAIFLCSNIIFNLQKDRRFQINSCEFNWDNFSTHWLMKVDDKWIAKRLIVPAFNHLISSSNVKPLKVRLYEKMNNVTQAIVKWFFFCSVAGRRTLGESSAYSPQLLGPPNRYLIVTYPPARAARNEGGQEGQA